jgi:large subunit ribosomal protein L15
MMNTLKRTHPNKTGKRVGRGQSSGKGKTSGRGTKGQKARGNTKMRPALRDIIKKLPKRRGYGKNRARGTYVKPELAIVNVGQISGMTAVNPEMLVKAQMISPRLAQNGVKILGTGTITTAVTVSKCIVSAAAREKITAAGGSIA